MKFDDIMMNLMLIVWVVSISSIIVSLTILILVEAYKELTKTIKENKKSC